MVGGDYVLWNTKSLAVQDASGGELHHLHRQRQGDRGGPRRAVPLFGPVWLGVDFFYSSTSFTFDEGQPQAAGSATDRYLGGSITLRVQF